MDLNQAHPLPIPLTLYVEPTNICNFRCSMCPESLPNYKEQAGYYQRMPLEIYLKIIEDLKGWGRVKSLKFYFLGEPLLNGSLRLMIRLARDAEIAERLELTTNASLITEQKAEDLVNSGLHYVRISVYGLDNNGHELTTGSRWKASQIRENVARFKQIRDEMGSKTPILYAQFFSRSKAETRQFEEAWKPIVDETGIEPLHNWAGAPLVNIGDQTPITTPCPAPFYMLVIRADGSVSACCVDWAGQLVVGNVLESTLQEIWQGTKLQSLQAAHLCGKRDRIEACRNCTAQFPDRISVRA